MVAHLERHGVPARLKAVESGRQRFGDVILAEAAQETADLLVMGGYGHSKLREALLGGATRTLLADATLPVILSHRGAARRFPEGVGPPTRTDQPS